ncbi:hypothetical protein CHUAL_005362 [Chamberlinius hualienensis]
MLVFVALFCWMKLASCSWQQTWSDEFTGPAGSAPGGQWVFDIGGSGWGNQELQYYTDSRNNSALNGNGYLEITSRSLGDNSALNCWYGKCKYTSARLKTQGKFDQTYGKFEARIKVPEGQGLWPAFWMLGSNINTVSWPKCGEIDIMEIKGSNTNINHGTIHGLGYSGGNGLTGQYNLPNNGKFSDDYHVFSVEWSAQNITWLVDNNVYETRTPSDIPKGTQWDFDHSFFILLNLAVGGLFDGNPANTITQPQIYSIDYVRAYKWQ